MKKKKKKHFTTYAKRWCFFNVFLCGFFFSANTSMIICKDVKKKYLISKINICCNTNYYISFSFSFVCIPPNFSERKGGKGKEEGKEKCSSQNPHHCLLCHTSCRVILLATLVLQVIFSVFSYPKVQWRSVWWFHFTQKVILPYLFPSSYLQEWLQDLNWIHFFRSNFP